MPEQTITARVERIPEVWAPKAKLYVPHEEREIVFAYPGFGPDTYKAVGEQILEGVHGKDLAVPTGDYTASLLHAAYCDPFVLEDPEFQDIRKIVKRSWLWVYDRNIFTEDGVFVISDLKATGIGEEDIGKLESVLTQKRKRIRFSEDGKVRFAPKETYKFGEHTSESLAQDGFIRASYGFEGAKKLGKVSAKFKNNPITYGVNVKPGDAHEQRISALVEDDDWLSVRGDGFVGNDRCLAFGVFVSCEAGAKK